MNAKNLIIPLLLVLFCCMLGCRNKQHNKVNENVRDLSQIKDSGELVVLTLTVQLHISTIVDRKWVFNTNLVSNSPKVWD